MESTNSGAGTVTLVIGDQTLEAGEKTFSTGSKGYSFCGKVVINGKPYQLGCNMVLIGSKPKAAK